MKSILWTSYLPSGLHAVTFNKSGTLPKSAVQLRVKGHGEFRYLIENIWANGIIRELSNLGSEKGLSRQVQIGLVRYRNLALHQLRTAMHHHPHFRSQSHQTQNNRGETTLFDTKDHVSPTVCVSSTTTSNLCFSLKAIQLHCIIFLLCLDLYLMRLSSPQSSQLSWGSRTARSYKSFLLHPSNLVWPPKTPKRKPKSNSRSGIWNVRIFGHPQDKRTTTGKLAQIEWGG